MSSSCDDLYEYGTIRFLKKDILCEADRDLYFFIHIKSDLERAGLNKKESTDCIARIILDLVTNGYCSLAEGSPPYKIVQKTKEEIVNLVRDNDFGTFLVSTTKGAEWVKRYEGLVKELE